MSSLPDSKLTRLNWLDIARGIGIILVVIGHVGEGIIQAELNYPNWMENLVKSIYTFHMPLFFIMSGFLFQPSFQKVPDHFIRIKTGTILYPYLVWSIIQTVIEVVLSSYTNKGISINELYEILWQPRAHFWYLHALFIICIINYLLFRYIPRYAVLIGIGLSFVRFLPFDYAGYWMIPLHNLFYFNIGILLWQNRNKILHHLHDYKRMAGFSILFFLGQAWYLQSEISTYLIGVALALLGSFWVLSLSGFPFPKWISQSLQYLGENSLYIYLLHVLTGSGVRIVMGKFLHINNGELHLLAGTIAGIILPILLTLLIRKVKCMWIFSVKI